MRASIAVRVLAFLVLESAVMAQLSKPYDVEQESVPGGGELLTIIRHLPGAPDTPLVSVLRDTSGNGDLRLRYLWILTSLPPTASQRLVAALPFAHFGPGIERRLHGVPKPFLDLAAPGKNAWSAIFEKAVQLEGLDSLGSLVRSTTRSYQGNKEEYRNAQVFRALAVVQGLLSEDNPQPQLSGDELHQIYSRLSLSTKTLGGWMQNESLEHYYEEQMYKGESTREHNWELLRQSAELSGLYFEPIPSADGTFREALLWIARGDLSTVACRHFDERFLKIRNPWRDHRLFDWNGFSTLRQLDFEGRSIAAESPDNVAVELIPLALYSLEYPRVPLVLIDFRDSMTPRVREFAARDASIFLSGILGVTRFTNWPLLAAMPLCNFVRRRHGATSIRNSRWQAYSQAREDLSTNATLDPALKTELVRRMEQLRLDPFEYGPAAEMAGAREQYALLQEYAASPQGLTLKVNRNREEKQADLHRGAMVSRIFKGKSKIPQ